MNSLNSFQVERFSNCHYTQLHGSSMMYKVDPFTTKAILLAIFCCLFSIASFSQSVFIIDSLKKAVSSGKTDSAKITALTELAFVYVADNYRVALHYCDSAMKLATTSKEEDKAKLQCYATSQYAGICRAANDTLKYKNLIKDAEHLAQKLHDNLLIGLVYHEQGMYSYYRLADYQKAIHLFHKSNELLENSNYHRVLFLNYGLTSVISHMLADYDKNLSNTKKALSHAKTINDRIYAYYYLGNAYVTKGISASEHGSKIDSGMYYLKYARRMMYSNKKRIKDPFLLSGITVLIAKIYSYHRYTYIYNIDSAVHYLEESRKEAFESQNQLVYAHSCVGLSRFYLKANNVARAEVLLDEARRGFKQIKDKKRTSLWLKADIYYETILLREKKNQNKEAIAALKQFYELKDTLYNIENLTSIQRTEAKFAIEKKEQQLQLLKEREIVRKRSIYFSFTLSGLGLLLLFMIYRSHLFRKRFFDARKNAIRQQNEYARLKKEETERLLQIEIEDSKKAAIEYSLETKQKEQYQRELMASVLHLEKKNELFLKLKETTLNTMIEKDSDPKTTLDKRILKLIDESLEVDNDFERFSKNFELIYPNFFSRLKENSTEYLSQLDLRYCAYISMGLSTKEISNLLNIDPASVRTARYRLKQKFNLGKEIDLADFINSYLLN